MCTLAMQTPNHKTDCVCIKAITVDERATHLGFNCAKCGKSLDYKVLPFLQELTKRGYNVR